MAFCVVTLSELDTHSVTVDTSGEELETAYAVDEEGEASTTDVFDDEVG